MHCSCFGGSPPPRSPSRRDWPFLGAKLPFASLVGGTDHLNKGGAARAKEWRPHTSLFTPHLRHAVTPRTTAQIRRKHREPSALLPPPSTSLLHSPIEDTRSFLATLRFTRHHTV